VVVHGAESASAFRDFFESEYERMFHTLFLTCGNREEAEDLTQEAMARAFEHWDRVRAAQSPARYVYKIAFNLLRRRRQRAALGRLLLRREVEREDSIAKVERRAGIVEVLLELPLGQREALVLVDWWGMSSTEAGRILGIKPASVRSRLHRGRTALRKLLGGEDDA